MLKTTLTILLPLITPLLCYFVFVYFHGTSIRLSRAMLSLLIGLCCVVAVLITIGLYGEVQDSNSYAPAIFKDGKVIEGHFNSN